MNKNAIWLALLAGSVVAGSAVVRPAASEAPTRPQVAPEVAERLLDFDVAQVTLPQAAGQAFETVVSLGGQEVTLSLEPHSVRSADFQLLVRGPDGLEPVEAAPPRTYRGHVAGNPGSSVSGALLPNGGLQARIVLADQSQWFVEPLPQDGQGVAGFDASHVIYRDDETLTLATDKGCGIASLPDLPGVDQHDHGNDGAPPVAKAGGGTGREIVELGCAADVEYYNKNGSSVDSTMADIENVINSMDAIYENQIDVTFEISVIVVSTVEEDGYTSNVCSQLLGQFRTIWASSPEVNIRRDLAQLFTGRVLSDCLGIAYVGTACMNATQFHYSVVESKPGGFFPFNRRIGLSAHEIGHSFDADHCCGGCAGCSACRIMCPCIAGCSGIVTSFGAAAEAQIVAFAQSRFCFHPEPLPLTPPFFEDFPSGVLNPDHWTYNDGGTVSSAALSPPSPALALRLETDGPGGLYQDHDIRTNYIDMTGLAGMDYVVSFWTQHDGVEAGESLTIEYWKGKGSNLWEVLTTIVSDGVDQTTFTEHVIALDDFTPFPFQQDFRLRFRTDVDQSGDPTNDDWYVDDIRVDIAAPPACPWDCEDTPNGFVDIPDLFKLFGHWLAAGPCDFDGNGTGDINDLFAMFGNWGVCP